MSKMKIVPAGFQEKKFNCPHCKTYSFMNWTHLRREDGQASDIWQAAGPCCNKESYWLASFNFESISGDPDVSRYLGKMLFPVLTDGVPEPEADMPDDCLGPYKEAALIVNLSPAGSAALIRVVIEKLCKHLGAKNGTINDAIADLVAREEISVEIQQALDVVRVIGNEAVHPGQIDINENKETVIKLFELVNYIVRDAITGPNDRKKLYESLPEQKRKYIDDRDKAKKNQA